MIVLWISIWLFLIITMSLYAYFLLNIPLIQGIPLTILMATIIFDSYYQLDIQYGTMAMFIWLLVQVITLLVILIAVVGIFFDNTAMMHKLVCLPVQYPSEENDYAI